MLRSEVADTSGAIVLTNNEEKNGYASMPPWLRRSEESTPDMIESEVDSLVLTLSKYDLSEYDISDIIKAIYLTASGNVQLIIGAIDFCKLILRMEDPSEGYRTVLVSKDFVLASIMHYSECVTARQDGIYQDVQKALGGSQVDSPMVLAGSMEPKEADMEITDKGNDNFFPKPSVSLREKPNVSEKTGFGIFSVESLRLAEEASRVKRAEILTDVVLTGRRVLSKGDYGDISNLLLSVSNDWRALAIRCIASLHRLEGIIWDMPLGSGEYIRRDSVATFNARYSIRVYANLSQRMGLHRLQSQLEGSAFRILYPRQFSAVSTLLQQKEEAMRAVSTFLSSEITKLINSDLTLVEQLEDYEIQARVKTPFSFWKKLVKKRLSGSNGATMHLSPMASISVLDVLDGVALRVILKAQTLREEDDDLINARERMLCYYVHHLIRSQWPETDMKRVKDYIKAPKPNGYQSLHHTSSIIYNGQQIPFEVQVRSSKMHKLAEFGIAAHWDYKANNRKLPSLAGSACSQDVNSSHGSESRISTDSEYIGALDNAREHLQQSSVYVFLAGSISDLEGGLLISLEAGSQIVDILKELKTRFDIETSSHKLQVWRNGNLALPDDCVRNGDVVLFRSLPTNGSSHSDTGGGEKNSLSLPYKAK
ncbi:MAG: hypothetical protein SGBAC_005483 [Bacillariaceae sp.]